MPAILNVYAGKITVQNRYAASVNQRHGVRQHHRRIHDQKTTVPVSGHPAQRTVLQRIVQSIQSGKIHQKHSIFAITFRYAAHKTQNLAFADFPDRCHINFTKQAAETAVFLASQQDILAGNLSELYHENMESERAEYIGRFF